MLSPLRISPRRRVEPDAAHLASGAAVRQPLIAAPAVLMQPSSRAAVALALHVLLSHIEKDPEGFVLRNLPSRLQHLFRHHIKRPANAAVDLAAAVALPLLQPRGLRLIPSEVIQLTPSLSLEVFRPVPRGAAATTAPVLLFVHGGIWTLGNRFQVYWLA